MKKTLLQMLFVVTFFAISTTSASAVVNDTVKVGLRYGDTALFSANLENAIGSGYKFGYFDDERDFVSVGKTDEIAISMTAAGDIYMSESGIYSGDEPSDSYRTLGRWHVQINGCDSFDDAVELADEYGGYPAWIDWEYVVRIGCYDSVAEAETAAEELGEGYAVASSDTGILVTVTRSTNVLFEFDCSGVLNFGVRPMGGDGETSTWFKGYKYPGAFEYSRVTGGDLNVVNVVDLEQYVKGVIPYEMNRDWPLAALEAQAICARTYACRDSKHQRAYGFDVCNTTDCQVYYGYGSGNASPSSRTNDAVDNTKGLRLYYDGKMIQNAVYHSSNGGATEDVVNVWGSTDGYLEGKYDPYEAQISIPNYTWSETYTNKELTWILDQKGYDVGTVKNVYISAFSPLGNVKKITFEGTAGNKTVSGETCRTIFYSSTYGKSAKSMRFGINGSGPAVNSSVYVNDKNNALTELDGISVISGSGELSKLSGSSFAVLTASGKSSVEVGAMETKPTASNDGTYTLTGAGSGHNLGMSQYGAKAMAELGYSYEDILTFYYTDITIE